MTTSTPSNLLTLARERESILAHLNDATSIEVARLNAIERQLDTYQDQHKDGWKQVMQATKAARAEREAAAKISAA